MDISIFQQFKDWLYSGIIALLQKLESLALTIFDLLKDFFYFIVDSLLSFAISILNTFTIPLNWNPSQYINALPPEVTNMLGLIGLGECFTIITTAILIRLGLQLIPFVRLGS